jgi:stage III sporulation protein AC
MDTELIMRIIGIALTVAVSCMILQRLGRDDQATLVSISGVVIILIILVGEIATLFESVRDVFGF